MIVYWEDPNDYKPYIAKVLSNFIPQPLYIPGSVVLSDNQLQTVVVTKDDAYLVTIPITPDKAVLDPSGVTWVIKSVGTTIRVRYQEG